MQEEESSKHSQYMSIKEQVREVFLSKDELFKKISKGFKSLLKSQEDRLNAKRERIRLRQ